MYVDGFVLPVPKRKLEAYKKIARKAGRVWNDHGALEYRECAGVDMKKMPFDAKRMLWGGFTVVVSA